MRSGESPSSSAPGECRSFSIARLTAKDKGKWPVAFQDNQFDRDRRAFEKALDNALEQQYKGNVQLETIDAVQKTVDNLEYTLEKVVGQDPGHALLRGQGSLEGDESDSGDAQDSLRSKRCSATSTGTRGPP